MGQRPVAPAKAGAHIHGQESLTGLSATGRRVWIPAFAGMTAEAADSIGAMTAALRRPLPQGEV